MELKNLAQPQVITFFENAIERDLLVNTYLFTGEIENSILFAKELVKKILKTDSLQHPDYFEYSGKFKVEDAREINKNVYIKPYNATKKCYIVPLEECTIEAQNALLKTLEEPPAYALFIIIASSSKRLLPTILSRALEVAFKGISEDTLLECEELSCFSNTIEKKVLVQLAAGSYPRLQEVINNKEISDLRKKSYAYLIKGCAPLFVHKVQVIENILEYFKDQLTQILMFWSQICLDTLLVKAGLTPQYYIENEYREGIMQLSEYSYSELGDFQKQITLSLQYLKSNVSAQYLLENLLIYL